MKTRVTVSVLTALAYVVALCLGAPSAGAVPAKKLDNNLEQLWTTVFLTPSAQNPFGSGGAAFACVDLGGTVAPFAPPPGFGGTCTVKPGTKIFVVANSVECSTFTGDTPNPPTPPPWTEEQLRTCARTNDLPAAPTVTVDGKPVLVTEAQTPLLNITLPPENIFGLGAQTTGQSVAHGWVTLLNPLTPGTHTIGLPNITTTIDVTPGLKRD
jgi:hypothetical protein